MTVLHLLPSLNDGGTETIVLNLCRELNNRNYNSAIACFYESKRAVSIVDVKIFICNNCKVELHILKKSFIQTESYELLIDNLKPDIIHSHSYYTHLIALSNKRQTIKYFFHFHLFYPNLIFRREDKLIKKLRIVSERYFVSFLILKYFNSKILVVSNPLKTYLYKQFPFWIFSKITLVPNGVKIDSRVRALSKLFATKLSILTVSRLIFDKDLNLAIQIANLLKLRGVEFNWTIVGSGTLKEILLMTIKELRLEAEVRIVESVDDMGSVYLDNDIYVHTSRVETFGLSIIEAMSFGLPVIVRNNLGSEDYLINDFNGIYLESKNPNIYVDQILRLVSNPDFCKNIVKNAFRTVEDYRFEKFIDRINNLYKN